MNEVTEVFYKKLRNDINTHKLRCGQTVFNTMYSLHPETAQKYCGTSIDPFHNDDAVNEFIEKCFEEID